MKTYIGTKIIKAILMTDLEFEQEKARFNEAKSTVQAYQDGISLLRSGAYFNGDREPRESKEGYKVMYPDGYTSWSPKHVFESAYREISESERKLI